MLVVVAVAVLIPATIAAGYYFVLTTLGWWPPRPIPDVEARRSFAVLIPAHDEELMIAATLGSVGRCDYPPGKVRTFVIADNCTDRTADVARAAGAECHERTDPVNRGKGYALEFGVPLALATGADVVLVLDADSELDPKALRTLGAAVSDTTPVVQAAVVTRNGDPGPTGFVAAVGSALDNAVAAGLARLGKAAPLRGSGMAFHRDVLVKHPWTEFGKAEDAEYAAVLNAAGVRVGFEPAAVVRTVAPAATSDLCTQRRRWRAALRVKTGSALVRWVASKPLVLGQFALAILTLIGLAAWLPVNVALALFAWTGVLLAMHAVVYGRAMARSGTKFDGVVGTVRVCGVVARLVWLTLGTFFDRSRTWQRTPRAGEPVGLPG